MSRYDVRGLDRDKDLVRSLAKRLAENDAAATRLRRKVAQSLGVLPTRRGGILAALRRSPLVGADLNLERELTHGRDEGP
jgi:hypothetical protein